MNRDWTRSSNIRSYFVSITIKSQLHLHTYIIIQFYGDRN